MRRTQVLSSIHFERLIWKQIHIVETHPVKYRFGLFLLNNYADVPNVIYFIFIMCELRFSSWKCHFML